MNSPVLVIGAGGHGRVLAEALLAASRIVLGFLDRSPNLAGTNIDGLPVLGDDTALDSYDPAEVTLANGLGSTQSTRARRLLYEDLRAKGFRFETVMHPASFVSSSAKLQAGSQVMAGATVQRGALIGENVIINTGAIVEHDCTIGKHSHLSSGAVLSGAVRVGEGCHVGAGAVVIQRIVIGPDALIAAGAVVIRDVPAGAKVAGAPARGMSRP